jgi:uncharacterized protein (DUF1810 family)
MRQSRNGDPYDLERFVAAQNPVFDAVCGELRQGRKTGHWMWFVFPQIADLGASATAMRYAIASREEARAYLEHAILGPRLHQCTRLVTWVRGRTVEEIFGYPDYMKFRSSLTLLACATAENSVFLEALQKYFSGAFDPSTLEKLARAGDGGGT